jgi:hypothetical protein
MTLSVADIGLIVGIVGIVVGAFYLWLQLAGKLQDFLKK